MCVDVEKQRTRRGEAMRCDADQERQDRQTVAQVRLRLRLRVKNLWGEKKRRGEARKRNEAPARAKRPVSRALKNKLAGDSSYTRTRNRHIAMQTVLVLECVKSAWAQPLESNGWCRMAGGAESPGRRTRWDEVGAAGRASEDQSQKWITVQCCRWD